jgi:sigma-B regulation protein RsbU (phosphoserine phosphatase)
MSRSALADFSPLPAGIRQLLDRFRTAYGDPDLRLLGAEDGAWVCLYPDAEHASAPWTEGHNANVELNEGPALRIEVRNGCADDADTRFLAGVLSTALAQEREAQSAARELTERYEEINLLYLISEILGSVLSVTDAATRILAEVVDVLGARRASLWVYRPEEDQLHLAAAVGEEGLSGPIRAGDTQSITAWVFREKQPLNLERGWTMPIMPSLEPRPHGTEAFLSVPINYTPPEGGPRTVGVITLVGRRTNNRFTAGDARLLSAIASQVGAALETQRLVQESLRQERMVRELELAHDLQLKLLPDPGAFNGPLTIAARCVPAESVGGDFYQLFRLPGNRLGIMIGDVSSHGFPAALIMALVMSAVSIHAPEAGEPGEVLRRVHAALAEELESTEMYLSLFYGVIDGEAGTVTWSNAGHPQAFRITNEGEAARLGASGPPLGLLSLASYPDSRLPWHNGDLLLLFTDGLSDSLADGGEPLATGENVLIHEVTQRRHAPLEATLDAILELADTKRPDLPPDDRTILLVRG